MFLHEDESGGAQTMIFKMTLNQTQSSTREGQPRDFNLGNASGVQGNNHMTTRKGQ